MACTILVLGAAGETGRALSALLLAETDARLVLAGRGAAALERAAGLLDTPARVTLRGVDAREASLLAPALAGVDLAIVAAPLTHWLPQLARAAASAGADLLDIQYSPTKIARLVELEPLLRATGRTVITDGGFHPGLPAVLARAVEDRFDVLRSARVGSVIRENWASVQVRPETADELFELFGVMEVAHVRDGRWVRERWTSRSAMTHFDFGPPYGRRVCFAMGLEEMRLWARERPHVRQAGFYVGGFNPVVDYALLPLVLLGQRVAPRRATRPCGRLLTWGLRTFTRPPYGTVLRLEAEGERSGESVREVLTVYHADGYALTAIPVVAAVRQWLDGTLRGPGVRLQALAVEPHRFLHDMVRMGVTLLDESGPLDGSGPLGRRVARGAPGATARAAAGAAPGETPARPAADRPPGRRPAR